MADIPTACNIFISSVALARGEDDYNYKPRRKLYLLFLLHLGLRFIFLSISIFIAIQESFYWNYPTSCVFSLRGGQQKQFVYEQKVFPSRWRGRVEWIFIAFDMENNLQNKLKPSGISRSFSVGTWSTEWKSFAAKKRDQTLERMLPRSQLNSSHIV